MRQVDHFESNQIHSHVHEQRTSERYFYSFFVVDEMKELYLHDISKNSNECRKNNQIQAKNITSLL